MAYTGFIYIITNEINGKSYIGKTNDLVRRWKEHCYGHGGTAILNKAFKKYGLEHFVFDIIAQIPFDTIEELNDVLKQLEIYYIDLYNTFNNGYNATAGGDGISCYKQSKETTEKIRKANLGRFVSEETKSKISKAKKGQRHSQESIELIRKALLNRNPEIYKKSAAKHKGVKRDPEMIMRGAIKRRKCILQYDMNGNFIKEYNGACEVDFCSKQAICLCCKGKLMSTGGYMWKYKESDSYPLHIEVPNRWETFKKPVLQCNINGDIIREFSSVAEASRKTGIHNSNIHKCLSGEYKQIKGYTWRYKERKEVKYA